MVLSVFAWVDAVAVAPVKSTVLVAITAPLNVLSPVIVSVPARCTTVGSVTVAFDKSTAPVNVLSPVNVSVPPKCATLASVTLAPLKFTLPVNV